MRLKKIVTFLSLVALFILCINNGVTSQLPVTKSSTKASIGGVAYYIHIVQKSETLYSIARAYNVSTDIITRENKEALYGLQPGQVLKIPVEKSEPLKSDVRDDQRYIYHELKQGETIYSLSKRYDIPEERIRESNPDMDIYDLEPGSLIAIPRKPFSEEKQFFQTSQEEGIILHKVRRGENMSSIARMYNISVRKLRNANSRMVFPKVGEYLRIPGQEADLATEVSDTARITQPPKIEEDLSDEEKMTYLFDGSVTDYTPVENLKGSVNVTLMLPLYLDENSARTYIDSSNFRNGKRVYKRVKRDVDWIYPGSELFVEFYEGVLLAVDQLRSKGLDISLDVYDTRADSATVDSLLERGILRNSDLVIGPVYSANVELVSDYARKSRIPVVSPLATRTPEGLRSNPYLFKVQPSKDVIQDELAKRISHFSDHNLVLVHSDTAWNNDLSSGFKSKIFRELRYVRPLDEVSFRQVFFASRSAYGDTINILAHAMVKDKPNLVIIDSDDMAVMSEVLVNIHTLMRTYDIKVIGYPGMRWLDNLDPKYFYELGLMVITPTWVDYSQPDVKDYINLFRDRFNMEPSIRSYAWQSYDIAYYFISGLALEGSDFKYRPTRHNPDLLQVNYTFRRAGLFGGFENRRLYLIRYTPDMGVEFLH